ncbi:hypothetical protein AVEN_250279-1, partial [Araneus ventricosus]
WHGYSRSYFTICCRSESHPSHGMQLEFPSRPKPSGTPDGAARSDPAQHDSTSQHLAGAEFAQPTRHQTPQMQAQLYNEIL